MLLARVLGRNALSRHTCSLRWYSLSTLQERAKFKIAKEGHTSEKDAICTKWLETVSSWLLQKYNVCVLVEPQAITDSSFAQTYSETEKAHLNRVVDFVITLGGDGSLLHVSSLFANLPPDDPPPPPILSFHLGTLGVLMPFEIGGYKEAISAMMQGGFSCTSRMRLYGETFRHDFVNTTNQHILGSEALNEITIHRSTHPLATTIQCTVNGHALATVVGDGLIVATSTGSTAYSLWCGGPMVHPGVAGMLLTPISPRGIARPALLPEDAIVRLGIAPTGRATASVSFDGNPAIHIDRGDIIRIRRASHPLYTVAHISPTADWVQGNHKLIDQAEAASSWITAMSNV